MKEEETQVKSTENYFFKIKEEKFQNLKKETSIKMQEACRIPDRQTRKKLLRHIVITIPNVQNREETLKATVGKDQFTCKGSPTRVTLDSPLEIVKARSTWVDVL